MESWQLIESIERFKGLNALDVGSVRYNEYTTAMHELAGSHDANIKEAEYALGHLGIKIGVAVTLNPSSMPPLDSELKYANERGLKIELCEDSYWRWFKPVKR